MAPGTVGWLTGGGGAIGAAAVVGSGGGQARNILSVVERGVLHSDIVGGSRQVLRAVLNAGVAQRAYRYYGHY